MGKIKHLLYVPWTGLGNYNGFRGNKWLQNRIQIFKQFVIPSLLTQTNQDFVVWMSWRQEERNNPYVKDFIEYCNTKVNLHFVNTFYGICFYDDKYEDEIARKRLINSLHYSLRDLHDAIGETDYVYMTIQPSDDLYHHKAVEVIQNAFEQHPELQGVGFSKGYIINYWNKDVAEYNPNTNPPFYTIKFPTKVFLDPLQHVQYTSLKKDVGKYKKGTPLPSHEYVGDCLNYRQIESRGFLVGTHQENISTTWQIPYKGEMVDSEILRDFGIYDTPPLKIDVSIKKRVYFSLPYKVQRKIRYWMTEKFRFKIQLPKLFRTTKTHQDYWKNRQIDWQKEYISTWNHPHRIVIAQLLKKMQWNALFEAGCGGGANLVQIIHTIKDKQLGGSDINAEAIALAEKSFIGGAFFVCPNDDIMMSDKSSDVILSDMNLIYTGRDKIDKTLEEFKRVARSWLVLCEFDSESWFKRLWVKLISGYNVYDYKKELDKHGYYDIVKYRLSNQHWPGSEGTYQEGLRSIIIAKVPQHVY